MRFRITSSRLRRLILVLALASRGYVRAADAPAPGKVFPPETRLETVAVVADRAAVRAGDKVVATVEKGRMFGVIERRADEVEIQVCVGTDVRRGSLQTSDVRFLTGDDVDLAAEWLKMAKDLSPELDLPACKAKLDALTERVAAAAATGKTPREKARLIGVQLFGSEGFKNKEGVKGPDRLLDLRQADCFGFSFLYLCIGQRLRMPLCLVIAPEHAFVRCEDRGAHFNIETTQEGKLHDTDWYVREELGAQRFSQIGGTHLVSLPVPSALGALFEVWGVALEAMGKPAEACEKFAKAVEINPRYAEAYSNWGVALEAMGRLAEACEKFAKAVEISPRSAAAYSNWGAALEAMGKPAEACKKCAKAVEINPRCAEAYSNWGVALRAMGKAHEACERYAEAVEIKPRYAEAYSNWGVALRAMGKPAEACAKFAKAVEINPRYAEAYTNWGLALAAMGKAPEACDKYAKAVEINPRYAEAYFGWGWAFGVMGKYAEACEKCAKAVECNPRHANAYCTWGWALAKMGKPAEACDKYAKAVEINPRLAEAHFYWGLALKALLQNAEAIEKLDRAAVVDPALKPKVEDLRKELLGKK